MNSSKQINKNQFCEFLKSANEFRNYDRSNQKLNYNLPVYLYICYIHSVWYDCQFWPKQLVYTVSGEQNIQWKP